MINCLLDETSREDFSSYILRANRFIINYNPIFIAFSESNSSVLEHAKQLIRLHLKLNKRAFDKFIVRERGRYDS